MSFYLANRLFTGKEMLLHHAIIVNDDGTITDILPQSQLSNNAKETASTYEILTPAFIDIQIYGAGGKLLSVYPEVDALQKLYNYCIAGGASHFLPTVATNSYDVFYNCINAVKAYCLAGGKGCLGLHIEGPWLNPKKRGAHIESFIHSPTLEQVSRLLDAGEGVIKIITLAPEVCSDDVIKLIQSRGIKIFAGHSNASFIQANNAFNKGINNVTHLYNAMSGLQHREPGLVGASFLHKSVMASIVVDGHHVNFDAVKIAYKLMKSRLFCITDAVTETIEGPYCHKKEGEKFTSNNILSGSALTMAKALQNLVYEVDIELEEALRMVSLYPAKAIKLDNELGEIKVGCKINFTALDNDLNVVDVLTS